MRHLKYFLTGLGILLGGSLTLALIMCFFVYFMEHLSSPVISLLGSGFVFIVGIGIVYFLGRIMWDEEKKVSDV